MSTTVLFSAEPVVPVESPLPRIPGYAIDRLLGRGGMAGDRVAFVSNTYGDWSFPSGGPADLCDYSEVTDQTVDQLVQAGILRDDGIAWADEAEPQSVYVRALTHVWLDEAVATARRRRDTSPS